MTYKLYQIFKRIFNRRRTIYAPSTESVRQFEQFARNNDRLNRYYERKAEALFK